VCVRAHACAQVLAEDVRRVVGLASGEVQAVVKLSVANFDEITAATDAERAVPHFVEFFGARRAQHACRARW